MVVAGLVVRATGLGHSAFWNDEAWVALSTRVEGLSQFWLSLAVTPPAWAAALRPLAALPLAPETALRLLPLGFGALAPWAAWRAGATFGGGAVAGLAAAAIVAQDPLAIAYSRELKPYTAEAFLCLLALALAIRAADGRRAADLGRLAVVLVVAAPLAHAALLVAPPILAALLAAALARRDRRHAGRVAIAALGVGATHAAYYALVLRPRLHESLVRYFDASYVPAEASWDAARFVVANVAGQMAFAWGADATLPALVALGAAAAAGLVSRVAALALALLVAELVVLSAAGALPFDQTRISHFAVTALNAGAAAAAVAIVRRAWARPALRPVALAAAAAGAWVVATQVDRAPMIHRPEELGPLVGIVESRRQPGDGVLLYERSGFVWAYYARATPRLLPDPRVTVGFRPDLDAAVTVVDGRAPGASVARALARHPRVWFVGSRFRPGDDDRIRAAIEARAVLLAAETRPGALLLLAARRPAFP